VGALPNNVIPLRPVVGRPRVRPLTPAEMIVGNLDDLQRFSSEGRAAVLGSDFFDKARRFYNYESPQESRVVYHPLVRIAELQMLLLKESSDLTASKPKFFIRKQNQRDADREQAFRAAWLHLGYQMEWLKGCIYSAICGSAPMMPYWDAFAMHGQGAVRLKALDPEKYYPDPGAEDDDSRNFIVLEDQLTLEEIQQRHGAEATRGLDPTARNRGYIPRPAVDFPASGAGMPPGPMRTLGPLAHGALASDREAQGRIRVRSLFIRDSTELPFTDELGLALVRDYKQIPEPDVVPAFPTGRMIIEAQRRLLYDGPNPYPGFPVFRLAAMPALWGYWPPPPVRYVQDLQNLAEDMMSQTYENAYRTNNVSLFINRSSGLTSNDVDGLPGRVYFYDQAAGEKPAETVVTPPFPPHFLQYPENLLTKMKDILGYSPSRQGQPGAGNTSGDLFDASIFQSQALTRLRSELLLDCMSKVAPFAFTMMMQTMATRQFPVPGGSDMASWSGDPLIDQEDWSVAVDEASIRVDLQSRLQKLALTLARFGKIDTQTLYDWLDVPNSDVIAQRVQREQLIMMLQQSLQGKGGKRNQGGGVRGK
jgi:hypothetical protein